MRPSTTAALTDRKLLLILGFAPAGLGHLRVMDALYHGLPETVNPVVLGDQDKSIQTVHRLTTANPVGKAVFDWLQEGPFRAQTNRLLRRSLRLDNRDILRQMSRLMAERMERPAKIIAACTHFGLAHKLSAIKQEFQDREGVPLIVAVIVTDDTFQHIWYVDGADVLVVPSLFTREKYLEYGRKVGGLPRIEVVPYLIHPLLGERLNDEEQAVRARQLDPKSAEPVHMCVPISGAAVGTDYLAALMHGLHEKSDRFVFHVVGKDAPFTQGFLTGLAGKPWIDVRARKQNRDVITAYNELLQGQTLAFEVTKPSEQTFKCLAPAKARGGVIMLFTEPVGTQEFENIDFLRRHSLAPSEEANTRLWASAGAGGLIEPALLEESRNWRGVRIPADPAQAAAFIWWMHASGVFSRMLEGTLDREIRDEDGRILGPDGVAEFWDLVTAV